MSLWEDAIKKAIIRRVDAQSAIIHDEIIPKLTALTDYLGVEVEYKEAGYKVVKKRRKKK